MNNAHFLTVADAVESSAENFEAVVQVALTNAVRSMSTQQLEEAFFPELAHAEFIQLTEIRQAA